MSETQVEVRHRTVMDDETRHVSRIYADALYRSAEQQGQVETVLGELESLVNEVFGKDPGLELFFASAAVGRDRKGEVIRSAFEGRTSEVFRQFLDVLNSHDRLDMLRSIATAYRTLYDRHTRRLVVQVTSAVPLTDEERSRLAGQVKAISNFEPVLMETVDPDVLGGLIVRIQDWVFDASVRSRLQAIRQQLIERSSHGIPSERDHLRH